MSTIIYPPGEHVEKITGDYTFAGFVVAAFSKLSGEVRYVVEDDRGVLHIFSDSQLAAKPQCPHRLHHRECFLSVNHDGEHAFQRRETR